MHVSIVQTCTQNVNSIPKSGLRILFIKNYTDRKTEIKIISVESLIEIISSL